MAWIESHQSLGGHLKLRRLARMLRIHRAQAVGHLHFLWWWALDGAPAGDLSALTSAELAEVAEWPGDADAFVNALRECGWLDPDGRIHDWDDYAGRIIALREGNRNRQRRRREQRSHAPVTRDNPVTSRAGHGAETRPVTGLPNPTQPNPTQPYPTSVCAHTPRAGEVPSPPEAAHTPESTHTPGRSATPSREIPSLEAVLLRAQQAGLAEWKARDWFDEMEGCGWKDYAGREIRRWEAVLQRIAVKWRADGSPSAPPAAPSTPAGGRVRVAIDHSKGF